MDSYDAIIKADKGLKIAGKVVVAGAITAGVVGLISMGTNNNSTVEADAEPTSSSYSYSDAPVRATEEYDFLAQANKENVFGSDDDRITQGYATCYFLDMGHDPREISLPQNFGNPSVVMSSIYVEDIYSLSRIAAQTLCPWNGEKFFYN